MKRPRRPCPDLAAERPALASFRVALDELIAKSNLGSDDCYRRIVLFGLLLLRTTYPSAGSKATFVLASAPIAAASHGPIHGGARLGHSRRHADPVPSTPPA